ncbi:MAG: hypothetical protein LBM02_05050 [Lachnospiraceae bacterium]|jgi:hypothetical protein|nr:hypothetical protein [Lachnospiraceae bacterium]
MKEKKFKKKILSVALSLTVAFTSLVVFDGINIKKVSAAETTSQNTLTSDKGTVGKTQVGSLRTASVGNGMRSATPTYNVQATQVDVSYVNVTVNQTGFYYLEVLIGGKWYDAHRYYTNLSYGTSLNYYHYSDSFTSGVTYKISPFSQTQGYWRPGTSVTFRYGINRVGLNDRVCNPTTGEVTNTVYATPEVTWKIIKGTAKIHSVLATYYKRYSYSYSFTKEFKISNYGLSTLYVQYKSANKWKTLKSLKNTMLSTMELDKSCFYTSKSLKTNYYFRIYIPAGTYNNAAVYNFTSNPKDMSPKIYTKIGKSTRYIYYYSNCPKGSLRIYYKSGKKYYKIKTLTCTKTTKKWRLPYKYRKYIGKLYCNYDPSSSYKYYSNPGALKVKYI